MKFWLVNFKEPILPDNPRYTVHVVADTEAEATALAVDRYNRDMLQDPPVTFDYEPEYSRIKNGLLRKSD